MTIEPNQDTLVGSIPQTNGWSLVVDVDGRFVRLIVVNADDQPRGHVRVTKAQVLQLIELLIRATEEGAR